ncbi:bile acid:sodium symporter family protein [Empedobacter sedimenti]|uniref:bile acid:sodium symporter family protein n=1 Tax=Empedobacter sedimenti TaxID=3042610 RepID=UPI0024A6C608|nr:bile acid:sodium symporter family protein [Empedobacter sedimenti]
MFKKIKLPDPFILCLFLAIVIAYLFPMISLWNYKLLSLNTIIDFGVILVFFFYGLKLNWKEVFKDLSNWKMHLLIQSITFIVFPIIVLISYPIVKFYPIYYTLFIAIFYLASLPSTVSSSVVMVSIAKGNIPSAIFNASISGLIGIVVTPLWMSIFLSKGGEDFDLLSTFLDLILKIILPVIVGAILQPYLGHFYNKYKKQFGNLDKLTIILIVYNSFSHTFLDGLFTKIGVIPLIVVFIIVVLLFFIVFNLSKWIAVKMNFNREDDITIQFCATKKSLVHGSVIAAVLFSDNMGVYLIPIMLYHTFQLIYVSYIANQYAKEVE